MLIKRPKMVYRLNLKEENNNEYVCSIYPTFPFPSVFDMIISIGFFQRCPLLMRRLYVHAVMCTRSLCERRIVASVDGPRTRVAPRTKKIDGESEDLLTVCPLLVVVVVVVCKRPAPSGSFALTRQRWIQAKSPFSIGCFHVLLVFRKTMSISEFWTETFRSVFGLSAPTRGIGRIQQLVIMSNFHTNVM